MRKDYNLWKSRLEELNKLLFVDRLSVKSVAEKYGVTERVLRHVLEDFEIKLSSRFEYKEMPISPQELSKLLDERKSIDRVAKDLKVNRKTLENFAKRNGITIIPFHKPYPEVRYADLEVDIFADRLSDKEVAEKYGLFGEPAVRILSRRLGIRRPVHGQEYTTVHEFSDEAVEILRKRTIDKIGSLLPCTVDQTKILIPKSIKAVNYFAGRWIQSTVWYIPELGKYLGPHSYLKTSVESRLGISFDEWENRWYLELSSKDLYTEVWAEKKTEFYYSDKPEHTKEYIKRKLMEDHSYVCNFLMLKEDFIEKFNNTRKDKYVYGIVPKYDFSLIPEIIQSVSTKLKIICNNTKFNSTKEIGEFETTYAKFILEEKDSFQFSLLIRSESRKLTTEEFVDRANKVHNFRFDYSKVKYTDCLSPVEIIDKKTGETFFQKPVDHLSGRANYYNRSKGEIIIEDWLVKHSISFSSQYYIKELFGRTGKGVKIDFIVYYKNLTYYIEYNGKQHYEDIPFFGDFDQQIKRDEEVRDFVQSLQNHVYLEIPYTIKKRENIFNVLDSVILKGNDPNTIIDYKSLYKDEI